MFRAVEPPLGRWDPHQFKELQCPRPRSSPVAASVATHRLANLLTDRVHGVERRQRVLEHHGDLRAPEAPDLVLGQAADRPREALE